MTFKPQTGKYLEIDGTPVEESSSYIARLIRPWMLATSLTIGGVTSIALPYTFTADGKPHEGTLSNSFFFSTLGLAFVALKKQASLSYARNFQETHVIDKKPAFSTNSQYGINDMGLLTIQKNAPSLAVLTIVSLNLNPMHIPLMSPLIIDALVDFYHYNQVRKNKWKIIPRGDMQSEVTGAIPQPT